MEPIRNSRLTLIFSKPKATIFYVKNRVPGPEDLRCDTTPFPYFKTRPCFGYGPELLINDEIIQQNRNSIHRLADHSEQIYCLMEKAKRIYAE
ncbi:unnamed protein product, partial [Mesorhabditis spiculigera]